MAKKNPNIIKKTFEHWLPEELEIEFSLVFNEKMPELKEWTSAETTVPNEYLPLVEQLRTSLLTSYINWNEAELLSRFIAPFLFLVNFSGKNFKVFSERPIKTNVQKYELSGIVDFVAAKGIDKPQSPYFFLHEYKRYKGTEANPLGQVLSAMYAAQQLNNNERPIYGCFVTGCDWRFVLLQGNAYATSEGYDATSPNEIVKIWSILQETKRRVEEMAKEDN